MLAQQAASRQNQDPRRGIDSLMPHSSVRDHLWGHSGMLATSLHAGEFDVERSSRSLDSIMPWHPLSAGDLQSIDGHHFPLPPGAPKPGLPSEGPVTPSQLSFSGSVVAAPAQEAKTGYRVRIACATCTMQKTCILNRTVVKFKGNGHHVPYVCVCVCVTVCVCVCLVVCVCSWFYLILHWALSKHRALLLEICREEGFSHTHERRRASLSYHASKACHHFARPEHNSHIISQCTRAWVVLQRHGAADLIHPINPMMQYCTTQE